MHTKDKLDLSPRSQQLLAKYQDKRISQAQKQVDELKAMSLLEFVAAGITTSDAPFELVGRLTRKGWCSVAYNKATSTWKVWTNDYRSFDNVVVEEVQDMFESEE